VRGREAAWDFNVTILDTFDWAAIGNVELLDAGADKLLAHSRYDLRGATSGPGLEFDYWFVATVRQGKIVRGQ